MGERAVPTSAQMGHAPQQLVGAFESEMVAERLERLARRAQACMALGCAVVPGKDIKIIQKLASYGFFRRGGVLIGSHGFTALSNMLGVRWETRHGLLGNHSAPAGRHISIALPDGFELPEQDTIASLEIGQLPIREFSGLTSEAHRNPASPGVQIDLVSSEGTSDAIQASAPRIRIRQCEFADFSVQGAVQGVVFGKTSASLVNLPDPARFAAQQFICSGAESAGEGIEPRRELEQAAALVAWHSEQNRTGHFGKAWREALQRGPEWRERGQIASRALLRRHPQLAHAFAG
ncbi:MAG: hypothetical protein EON58_00090 [Alphaproteobacteria bacterium]|nr:MAG: hypothetical protein EON58_00090 [Alphaproteobacteria bacterium]